MLCEELENLGSTYIALEDEKMLSIAEEIKSLENFNTIMSTEIKNSEVDVNDVISTTKNILDNYFILNDVIYFPKKISKFPIIKKNQYQLIKSTTPISPYNIPITLMKTKGLDGLTIGGEIHYQNKKYDIINSISISSCEIAKEVYAHELIHTQNEMYYNNIFDIDTEVLSIFTERLVSDELDSEKLINIRLADLFKKITLLKIMKYTDDEVEIYRKIAFLKYILSTLKAYKLYSLYKTESLSSTKARVIDDINSVFSKEITLPELLNKYNITNDNCKDPIIIKKAI